MSDLTIVTNHQPRLMLYGYDLTAKERSDFDYLTDDEVSTGDFVRYGGQVYHLDDVEIAPDSLKALGWDGYVPAFYFAGVCFRYFDTDGSPLDGGDRVICGKYAALD